MFALNSRSWRRLSQLLSRKYSEQECLSLSSITKMTLCRPSTLTAIGNHPHSVIMTAMGSLASTIQRDMDLTKLDPSKFKDLLGIAGIEAGTLSMAIPITATGIEEGAIHAWSMIHRKLVRNIVIHDHLLLKQLRKRLLVVLKRRDSDLSNEFYVSLHKSDTAYQPITHRRLMAMICTEFESNSPLNYQNNNHKLGNTAISAPMKSGLPPTSPSLQWLINALSSEIINVLRAGLTHSPDALTLELRDLLTESELSRLLLALKLPTSDTALNSYGMLLGRLVLTKAVFGDEYEPDCSSASIMTTSDDDDDEDEVKPASDDEEDSTVITLSKTFDIKIRIKKKKKEEETAGTGKAQPLAEHLVNAFHGYFSNDCMAFLQSNIADRYHYEEEEEEEDSVDDENDQNSFLSKIMSKLSTTKTKVKSIRKARMPYMSTKRLFAESSINSPIQVAIHSKLTHLQLIAATNDDIMIDGTNLESISRYIAMNAFPGSDDYMMVERLTKDHADYFDCYLNMGSTCLVKTKFANSVVNDAFNSFKASNQKISIVFTPEQSRLLTDCCRLRISTADLTPSLIRNVLDKLGSNHEAEDETRRQFISKTNWGTSETAELIPHPLIAMESGLFGVEVTDDDTNKKKKNNEDDCFVISTENSASADDLIKSSPYATTILGMVMNWYLRHVKLAYLPSKLFHYKSHMSARVQMLNLVSSTPQRRFLACPDVPPLDNVPKTDDTVLNRSEDNELEQIKAYINASHVIWTDHTFAHLTRQVESTSDPTQLWNGEYKVSRLDDGSNSPHCLLSASIRSRANIRSSLPDVPMEYNDDVIFGRSGLDLKKKSDVDKFYDSEGVDAILLHEKKRNNIAFSEEEKVPSHFKHEVDDIELKRMLKSCRHYPTRRRTDIGDTRYIERDIKENC